MVCATEVGQSGMQPLGYFGCFWVSESVFQVLSSFVFLSSARVVWDLVYGIEGDVWAARELGFGVEADGRMHV